MVFRDRRIPGHGSDTRGIAEEMFLSEHIVHDHLKSVVTKTSTRNRRTQLAPRPATDVVSVALAVGPLLGHGPDDELARTT